MLSSFENKTGTSSSGFLCPGKEGTNENVGNNFHVCPGKDGTNENVVKIEISRQ
jgi:hypothetical protein